MPRQTAKKTPLETSQPVIKIKQKDLPAQLLTPEEFEAITKANYYHPESQLILKLFLHINYFRQVSRHMQGKSKLPREIDWEALEQSAATLIRATLSQLLTGVTVTPWTETKPNTKTRKHA